MPIDSTFLDIQKSDDTYQFGRDYIAHAVRWSLMQKLVIERSNALGRPLVIYDVGCGRRLPLAQTLFSNRHYNTIHAMFAFDQVIGKTRNFVVNGVQRVIPIVGDFCKTYAEPLGRGFIPDVICSFEAFEHMPFEHAWRFLRTIRQCCGESTEFYFSTPNYSHTRGAAKNHQNECNILLLKALLENCGFELLSANGLYCDLKRAEEYAASKGLSQLYESLKSRYENEVLSMLFAWDIPEVSKSVLYHCRPGVQSATDQEVIELANDPMFRQQ